MNKELNGNVIEQAIKVTSFRKAIREACCKEGLEYPNDEKVAEWIEQGNPFKVKDFMTDYKEGKGIFRYLKTPLEEFKEEIDKISWGEKPTEEEIVAFFNESGNNIDLFCQQRTIKHMEPLERKVYFAAMGLKEEQIVKLWNIFIEESALYGQDSKIIDLFDKEDWEYLYNTLFSDDKESELKITIWVAKDNVRYIQWFWSTDSTLKVVKDVKGIITAYWSEIYDRILLFPTCYDNFFSDFAWPIFKKELGLKL
jgi:hypothetical protein